MSFPWVYMRVSDVDKLKRYLLQTVATGADFCFLRLHSGFCGRVLEGGCVMGEF